MPDIFEIENKIKQIIDELKGLCSQNGLGNQADEERVITSVFLYKFLNDKFMYNLQKFAQELDMTEEEVLANENDELDGFYDAYSQDVAFGYKDTIKHLINEVSKDNFYKIFDDALVRISSSVKNELFSIETADGTKKGLFEPISNVVESSARNNFAQAIFSIISQEKFDFSEAFMRNFDFYSTIFEYLIEDYNVASGVYAEYFTPQSVSSIVAKILVGSSEKIQASEIYDPSAGSGSLVLHLAHELGDDDGINRAMVYTQDVSNKSSRFLRINMLLNGLTESLHNVRQGDTLLNPAHYNVEHDASSGLKKFDYIISNPPFRLDFSKTRNLIESRWEDTGRFFAGVPTVPKSKKESMAIYTLFFQHVLYSLKENGKAAVIVPNGFTTDTGKITCSIREYLVNNNYLSGVIQMPQNIFANTNTSVSIIFIDKAKDNSEVILIDASDIGKKIKVNDINKTILNTEDEDKIVGTFLNKVNIAEFSKKVTIQDIKDNEYLIKPGLFFEMEYSKLSHWGYDLDSEMHRLKSMQNGLYRVLKEDIARNLFIQWFVEYNFEDEYGVKYREHSGKMKLSECGEIPLDWDVFSLKDLVSDVIGGEWGKEFEEKKYNIPIKCIRGADIPDIVKGVYDNIPLRFVQEKHIQEKEIKENDIIIEISGGSPIQSTGRACYITKDILNEINNKVLCTNFCRIIRFKENIVSRVVYDYLRLLYDRKYLFNLENNTTGIKNLLISPFLNNVKIVLPNDLDIIERFYKKVDSIVNKVDISLINQKLSEVFNIELNAKEIEVLVID